MKKTLLLVYIFTILATIYFVITSLFLLNWMKLLLGLILIGLMFLPKKLIKTRIIIILLSLALLLGAFYIKSKIDDTLNPIDYETKNYSVYVLKDSDYKEIKDLTNLVMGYPIQLSEIINDFFEIEWKDYNFQYQKYNSPIIAAEALLENEIPAIVIDNATIALFTEIELEFLTKVRTIADYQKEVINEAIHSEKDISKDSFVVLISGIDVAGPISTVSRSDVNILMVVNPTLGIVNMYSIPRDSFLPLTCMNNNYDKLTHAGVYGINCTINSISQAFDVDIDYYVKVNFTSFVNIIDLFGTIDVYSHYTFYSGQYKFVKGYNKMSGEKALAFVRTRKTVDGGDLTRGLHQQEVIKAVLLKLAGIRSLDTLNNLMKQVGKSVATNVTTNDISRLMALQLDKNPQWTISVNKLEGTTGPGPSYEYGGQKLSMFYPSEKSLKDIQDQIQELLKRR